MLELSLVEEITDYEKPLKMKKKTQENTMDPDQGPWILMYPGTSLIHNYIFQKGINKVDVID